MITCAQNRKLRHFCGRVGRLAKLFSDSHGTCCAHFSRIAMPSDNLRGPLHAPDETYSSARMPLQG